MFFDVDGQDEECLGTSKKNRKEIQAIMKILTRLNQDAKRDNMSMRVAIISAYKGQAYSINIQLQSHSKCWTALSIKSATVDSFQGEEADIVLYSLVKTGINREFLSNMNRMNVSLSRARSLLILVGALEGIPAVPVLRDVVRYIPKENIETILSLSKK